MSKVPASVPYDDDWELRLRGVVPELRDTVILACQEFRKENAGTLRVKPMGGNTVCLSVIRNGFATYEVGLARLAHVYMVRAFRDLRVKGTLVWGGSDDANPFWWSWSVITKERQQPLGLPSP